MTKFERIVGSPTLKTGTIVYEGPGICQRELNSHMLAALSFVGADTELLHIVVASKKSYWH